MKAIPFLEWFINNNKTFDVDIGDGGMAIRTMLDFMNSNKKVSNFYSQPFKPEMITELFEGWVEFPDRLFETEIKYTKWFINDSLKRTISITYFKFPSLKKEIPFDYVSYKINRQVDFPISLDTFINDCKNIIELTWKPEIVKEYFT